MLSAQRETILVVDDNPATLYSTSRLLRASGYEVLEASSGREAVELASRGTKLVVLDVHLPDIDGFEVCRILRSQEHTARIPVVHLSATFVAAMDRVQGLEAGADGYLTHPVEPLVLIGTVKALLRTRRAEDRMRISEANFRAVFEQALGGIALFSEDFVYLDVNPAICRLLDREREAIVGTPLADFVSPVRRATLGEIYSALAERREWRGVLPLLRQDGSEVELEWHVSTHSLPGVRVAIVTDITDRRRAEREREELLTSERTARAEAERAVRIKDQFLAMLSHELRNPLSAVLSWAYLLQRQYPDPKLQKGLQIIERNARLQAQLIDDLLDVSRIATGKLHLQLETVNANRLLDAAIEVVAPQAQAAGIQLQRLDSALDVRLHADPARLQQIVWNLLTNAIKFSPQGATVTIRTRRANNLWEIEVQDQGRGIAADFLPHIFDQFRQEDASSKKSVGGLGLGLAIVKSLVDLHSGTITAHSDGEGLGATFTVRLPALPADVDGTTAEPAAVMSSTSNLQGLRVLVVEDDHDARAAIRLHLSEAGAQVFEASNAASALEQVESRKPELVVSDIGMASADGYDLIRAIRARGHSGDAMPAIALTAFARAEDRAAVLAAGFQRHLAKPYHPQQLLALIAELKAGG